MSKRTGSGAPTGELVVGDVEVSAKRLMESGNRTPLNYGSMWSLRVSELSASYTIASL